ncbi:MAG: hypothetical protein K0R66_437 [Gammaproteobacteria bacterium]|nr:hypothetical protein [Gammaproteobacteria bacterium]
MAKRNALTGQNVYQLVGAEAFESFAAVGINVAIGSILGAAGVLKSAPQLVLRILPGLGSTLNYIVGAKLVGPATHPQFYRYKAEQLSTLLAITGNDAEDLLAQRKSFKEVREFINQQTLSHQYIYDRLNQESNTLSMAEIKQMFPETVSRPYHTVKLADTGYEVLRLGTAAAVSYAMPAQMTDNEPADSALKGATALAAGHLAVTAVKGALTWFENRSTQAADHYRSLSSQEAVEVSLK